jgi:hypothetical protein
MPQSIKPITPFEEFLSNIPTMDNYLNDTNEFLKEQNLDFDIEVFKREHLNYLNEFLRDDFERQWDLTGNPVFVFGGLRFCKIHNLTIPSWIIENLFQSAEYLTLMDLQNSARVSDNVYTLLGLNFSGKDTFFLYFQDYFVRRKAYFKIISYRFDNPTASLATATRAIKEEFLKSARCIKNWYNEIIESWDNPKRELPKGYIDPKKSMDLIVTN